MQRSKFRKLQQGKQQQKQKLPEQRLPKLQQQQPQMLRKVPELQSLQKQKQMLQMKKHQRRQKQTLKWTFPRKKPQELRSRQKKLSEKKKRMTKIPISSEIEPSLSYYFESLTEPLKNLGEFNGRLKRISHTLNSIETCVS